MIAIIETFGVHFVFLMKITSGIIYLKYRLAVLLGVVLNVFLYAYFFVFEKGRK